jgi:hypothetical protein
MGISLRQTARAIKETLSESGVIRGQPEAIRLAFAFIEEYERSQPSERSLLVKDRPESVGDPRFDALLAAVAEHVCVEHGDEIPGWAESPDRFLDRWWFVAGLRSLEADALMNSPISFARRGVFITGDALTYI